MQRPFSILPYVSDPYSNPKTNRTPPFANNVSPHSVVRRRSPAEVEKFVSNLCNGLEVIQKQDEEGRERVLPGCKARNEKFARRIKKKQKLPFSCWLFRQFPYNESDDDESDDEALLGIDEKSNHLEDARAEPNANLFKGNDVKGQTLEEHTNLSKDLETDILRFGAIVVGTEMQLTNDFRQPARTKDQSERPPVEAGSESPTKKRRTGSR